MSSFDISIIIPNLNSPVIGKTINSLLNQDTNRLYEIIIVGMDKFGFVNSFEDKRIKFIETDTPTPPALARNLGAAASSGELLIFIDSDCVAASNLLEMHLKANNGIVNRLVGGAVKIDTNENYWTLSDNIATFHEILSHTPPGQRDILPSLNLSLSKSFWSQLGGFDPNYPKAAGEDADFSYRARAIGGDVIFTPGAMVTHLHIRDSLKSILRHAYNFGKYSIKIDPKYDNDKSLPFIFINYPWLIILFSPLLACGVIMKMIFIEKLPMKYWHTLPVVKFAKIAWCFGAGKKQNKNAG
jgi:glycosyltransferase involved in cell wall biosynthesis